MTSRPLRSAGAATLDDLMADCACILGARIDRLEARRLGSSIVKILAAPKRAVARDGLRATVGGPGRGRRSAWCPGNGQNGQNGQKKSAARPRELGAPFFSR